MGNAKMERTATPGVFRRGSRYVVTWRYRGDQYRESFRTYDEAREAKGQRMGGDRKPPSHATLHAYSEEWLAGYAGRTSRGFTEQTRSAYHYGLSLAVEFFDAGRRETRLADVEPGDVRRYVLWLERRGLSSASIVSYLTPLRAMFATALEDGVLRSSPCVGVRVNIRRDDQDDEAEPEATAMTRAQLAAVLGEVPDGWRLFFELLAKTGLRVSEALGLDWQDVDFDARMLRVRRQYYRGTVKRLKTRTGRRDLPISPGLARALWTARPADPRDQAGPVFRTRNGTRYLDRNVRRILDPATSRAGAPWVSFHTFRHTCASMLFAGGKNIKQVSEWLGHTDPAFTLRTYVHLMDEGLGGAEFLDAAVVLSAERPAASDGRQPDVAEAG
jgi:integrase